MQLGEWVTRKLLLTERLDGFKGDEKLQRWYVILLGLRSHMKLLRLDEKLSC